MSHSSELMRHAKWHLFLAAPKETMSCNDNQNHLVRPGRTTSRVLAPSGGQSSLTFGLMPPKPVVKEDNGTAAATTTPAVATETKTNEAAAVVETVVTNDEIGKDALGTTTEQKQQQPKQQFTTAVLPSRDSNAPISSNAFVSGSNMNGGCTMTDRPSSRVLAPPGGHTSFKLG